MEQTPTATQLMIAPEGEEIRSFVCICGLCLEPYVAFEVFPNDRVPPVKQILFYRDADEFYEQLSAFILPTEPMEALGRQAGRMRQPVFLPRVSGEVRRPDAADEIAPQ